MVWKFNTASGRQLDLLSLLGGCHSGSGARSGRCTNCGAFAAANDAAENGAGSSADAHLSRRVFALAASRAGPLVGLNVVVLPFTDSDVNSRVSTELPAKRPALFTSATRPTTSAPDGITVSPSSTIGSLSEPWKVSPTWLRSESSGLSSRMVNCVPAGIVTFLGGAGGGGGGGGGVCSAGAHAGGVSSAARAPAEVLSARFRSCGDVLAAGLGPRQLARLQAEKA